MTVLTQAVRLKFRNGLLNSAEETYGNRHRARFISHEQTIPRLDSPLLALSLFSVHPSQQLNYAVLYGNLGNFGSRMP
jgi:hypothetical protein